MNPTFRRQGIALAFTRWNPGCIMLGCFTRFVNELDSNKSLRQDFRTDPNSVLVDWQNKHKCQFTPAQVTLLLNILPPACSTTDAAINSEINMENSLSTPPQLTHVGLCNKVTEGS
jgi:hypothetical protein